MQQWEYHQEYVPIQGLSTILDVCQAAGEKGWELCSSTPVKLQIGAIETAAGGLQQVQGAHLLFKRPVAAEIRVNGTDHVITKRLLG